MNPFILLVVIGLIVGSLLGRYFKVSFNRLLLWCVLLTLAIYVVLGILFAGFPASYSLRYFLTAIPYHVFPYLIFLLATSLAALFLARITRAKK